MFWLKKFVGNINKKIVKGTFTKNLLIAIAKSLMNIETFKSDKIE